MAKSKLIFTKKVHDEVKINISHTIPMKMGEKFSIYLGMSTHIGR